MLPLRLTGLFLPVGQSLALVSALARYVPLDLVLLESLLGT